MAQSHSLYITRRYGLVTGSWQVFETNDRTGSERVHTGNMGVTESGQCFISPVYHEPNYLLHRLIFNIKRCQVLWIRLGRTGMPRKNADFQEFWDQLVPRELIKKCVDDINHETDKLINPLSPEDLMMCDIFWLSSAALPSYFFLI